MNIFDRQNERNRRLVANLRDPGGPPAPRGRLCPECGGEVDVYGDIASCSICEWETFTGDYDPSGPRI